MNKSKAEEIIGVLWLIAALIAFSNGYRAWGYIFAAKSICDQICAIYEALKGSDELDKSKSD